MGKCRNCLTFLYNLVCSKRNNRSTYEQDTASNTRNQSSIEEERRSFEYDNKCREDIKELSYDNLKNKQAVDFNLSKYVISTDVEGYKMISKRHYNLGDRRETKGYKVHIAISPANINLAWYAVMPLLVEYGIHDFKVILNPNSDETQLGKEIVIYQMSSPTKLQWQELLINIENKLREHNVGTHEHPNHRAYDGTLEGKIIPIKEPKINGSKYLYYTDDRLNKDVLHNYDWENDPENPFKAVKIIERDPGEATNQIPSSSNYTL